MLKFKLLITSILFAFISVSAFAQTNASQEIETLSLDSGTLESQFEYLTKKSTNWRDERGRTYEVIRNEWILKIKAHALDSLKAIKKDLFNTQSLVSAQVKEIEQLKSSLTNTKTNLDTTNKEKDSMSLFGLQLSKTGYNGLMWSIIAGLLAFLLFFIFKFKNSNTITKASKFRLNETEEEFEEHRRNALEREQKVRRQLQDEINKNRNS